MEKNKTIKIFLSSSNELSDDREKFGNFIRRIDKIYSKRGLHIDLFDWEDSYAFTGRRTQEEYNKKVWESDMFVALFYKKAGPYTLEEYDMAIKAYRTKKYPKVYVFCRVLQEGEEETPELNAFKCRLSKDDYFWTNYSNQDQLRLHFIQQLLLVENSLEHLKLEDGRVTLEGINVAELANLPFAADNKNYKKLKEELDRLPEEIELAQQYLNEHPDNGYMRDELQKKLDRYNALKEELAQLQKTLFETSQRIAKMQRERLSDKLRRATEAFESGNTEQSNTLLDEIEREAETSYANLSQMRELVHQEIDAFMLRAKVVMAEVNTLISERIKQVQAIYAKADEWAKESALPDKKYDGLLFDYARFLYDYGLYKAAEPVYLRLIALRENLYGKEHADTATSYNNIGRVYRSQGYYAKALVYYEKALDIRERVLGPDHPDTAHSYNNIGAIYYDQGYYARALEYYGKALDIRERVLGPDHPDTAQSYNNIGAIYCDQGDYPKALEYFWKALAIREKVLGKDHPDTASTYNNIGGVYDDQRNYPMALEYYRKALAIREKVLGKDHPDSAQSYNNIGGVYYQQEKYPEALEYLEKALEIRKAKLGEDHPDFATFYRNIGAVYEKKGDYAMAKKWYDKSLNVREQEHVLSKSADDTKNIDFINSNQSDASKSVVSLKQILDDTVRDKGYYDSKTKKYRVNIGSLLLQLK